MDLLEKAVKPCLSFGRERRKWSSDESIISRLYEYEVTRTSTFYFVPKVVHVTHIWVQTLELR